MTQSFTEYLKNTRKKELFAKENGVKYVTTRTLSLPEDKWYVCKACGGSKSYLESGDLHRSEGIVPCYNCNKDGLITSYRKEVYRAKARKVEISG